MLYVSIPGRKNTDQRTSSILQQFQWTVLIAWKENISVEMELYSEMFSTYRCQ